MNKNQDGYAVITGSSSGIGKAYAYGLAQRGYNLFLLARREQLLEGIAHDIENKYKVQVEWRSVDLADSNSREHVCDELSKHYRVTMLINNAGFGLHGKFTDIDRASQLDMIETNVSALVDLTHRILPLLIDNGSRESPTHLINIASIASFQPGPYYAVYYASKSFVLNFSEAISEELRCDKHSVVVSAVCPGPTQSEFFEIAGMLARVSDLAKKILSRIPSARSLVEYTLPKILRAKPGKQTVIVHGGKFKLFILLERGMSRALVRTLLAKVQSLRL